MIEKLLQDLQFDEGWREKPYRDSRGFLTIGFGFLIDERKSVELPKPVGLYWLEFVAEQRWSELIAVLPWVEDCDENVQRALANLAYNIGIAGVLGFKKMLAALKAGDRATAAAELLNSKYATQVPRRAKRVAHLIAGTS